MPAILLKVGCETILLPDDKGVATIIKALARGRLVYDRTYARPSQIVLLRRELEVGMSVVPRGTRAVAEDYQPTPEEQGYVRKKPKQIGDGTLLLGNGDILSIR